MALKFVIKDINNPDTTSPLEFNYDKSPLTIGSDLSANLQLEGLASIHAVIVDENHQIIFINKAEETLVNGKVLAPELSHKFSKEDLIQIKNFTISLVETDEVLSETGEPTYKNGIPKIHTNFAEILNNLRTQEDNFYFTLENGTQNGTYIPINENNKELLFKWDIDNQTINFNLSPETIPDGIIYRDWTGISFQPTEPNKLRLNGIILTSTELQRLKNGDRIVLQESSAKPPEFPTLVFKTPASLQILDSLFPQKIPKPILINNEEKELSIPISQQPELTSQLKSNVKNIPTKSTIFNVFSFLELILMVVGTFILAAIIFLILSLM